jgi:hypothetical protein
MEVVDGTVLMSYIHAVSWGGIMRTRILATALVVFILALGGSAWAQGAAEAALTHALSSSVGSSVGKAMGRATGQLAGKVGQQTTNSVQRQNVGVKNSTRGLAKVVPAEAPTTRGNVSLIASIQGAAPQQTACSPVEPVANGMTIDVKQKNEKTIPQPANSEPGDCAKQQPQTADSHPSTITLPAPK